MDDNNETIITNVQEINIIGVSASMDSAEVLYTLFAQTLTFDATFVIITQFSADLESIIAHLLKTQGSRAIISISHNMRIAPNSIYILTERKNIGIKQGRFILSELGEDGVNNVVNNFFYSLAAEQGDKSVAIVLSSGGDGIAGAESIRTAGGKVVVQDPITLGYNNPSQSMVLPTGKADLIAAPELMLDEIGNFLEQNSLIRQFTNNREALLLEVLELINKHTPLDFSDYKRPTIIRRIIRKMKQENIYLLPEYIQHIKSNPSEIESLVKEFMISVTRFFWDPAAFDILKKKILEDVFPKKEMYGTLKIWVVGCATGEEAYSIAILLQECFEETGKILEVKIFASDIDKEALAVASKGIYPLSIADDVSEARLSKFFYLVNGQYKVKESVRNMLIIAQHDITKNPPYYKLDLVTCRNMLIYMNPALQKKILATLHYCLNEGGYLFLGPSEGIGDLKGRLAEEEKKWKIYKNMKPAIRLENGTYSAPDFYITPVLKPKQVTKMNSQVTSENLSEFVAESLYKITGQGGVCIDMNYMIVKTFGNYKNYLLPEMFNFNLLEVLPKELSIVTATGLNQVIRENSELTIREVLYLQNDVPRSVDIYMKPIPEIHSLEKGVMVCFTGQELTEPIESMEVFNRDMHTSRYLSDLERELKETVKKLGESYEALEACNINAQSYNEELISGNEELQSTNEEVQSVNEELNTVNTQYQLKIKELVELNDDLNNYFQSTIHGQIYVDRNFIIRKFTRPAILQVNLKDSDIGRPISDISTNIKFSTMLDDMHTVTSESIILEKEIETLDRKWYQMGMHPYIRQKDNNVDGIIITFNDITALKIAQRRLIKINEDHNTFIFSVSHDLKGPLSNMEVLSQNIDEKIKPEKKELKKMSSLMVDSVAKLKEVIFELTNISKIENEVLEDFQNEINIKDLLEEIKTGVKNQFVKSHVTITAEFQEELISFSKKNLRSILLNLVTNAIKYKSPDHEPVIHLRTEKIGKYTVLCVQDNGSGIHPDKKVKIFSIFERVHTEDGIEGSGIGLYLVKKMMTNAGGKITVESELGSGSTFKVWFLNKNAS